MQLLNEIQVNTIHYHGKMIKGRSYGATDEGQYREQQITRGKFAILSLKLLLFAVLIITIAV